MATRSEVFLDTGYVVALVLTRDEHHQLALELARELDIEGRPVVTTTAIVFEITSALARNPYRQSAIRFVGQLRDDPRVTLLDVDRSRFSDGYRLFVSHTDKT